MTLLEPGRTTLRNVLVRDSRGDPLAVKLTLSRLLAAADFRAAGLPPGAILVVHHLRDPLPGKLRLEGRALSPPPTWESAARAALDLLARRADRPAHGNVPAGTPAVVFADRAELLACLARDFLSNSLAAHWWWQALFEVTDRGRIVADAWCEAPEYAPAALEKLAGQDAAAAFVGRLETATVRRLLDGILSRYKLPDLRGLVDASEAGRAPGTPAAQPKVDAGGQIPSLATEVPPAPWQRLVPEAAADGLTSDRRMLLGVALALQRAPGAAHSPEFTLAVRRWVQAVLLVQDFLPEPPEDVRDFDAHAREGPHRSSEIQKPGPPVVADDRPQAAHLPPAVEEPGASNFSPGAEAASVPQIPVDAALRGRTEAEAERDPLLGVVEQSGVAELAETGADKTIPARSMPTAAALPGPVVPAAQAFESPEEKPLAETIETQYGGVFYLLNLAQILGFYGDFTTPANPGLALSPWDFLALIGHELAGAGLESDPLWELLRRLAGRRADQPPGWGFEPPDGVPLDAWLLQTIVQVETSLLPALGLEDPADLCDLLCAHPARILLTSARLDITFSLAKHPLAIRLAGLDRDPGWIPAAGHYVVYHYD